MSDEKNGTQEMQTCEAGPSTTGQGPVVPQATPCGARMSPGHPARLAPVPGRSEGGRVQPNKHRKLQLTQPGKRKLFGKAAKRDFLEWFAATANLGWSARQAGFNYKTVLRHRMNDPVFAEAYDRALEQGVARVRAQLLETRIAEGEEAPIGIEGERDVPEMQKLTPEAAAAVLRAHGGYLAGPRAGAGEARKQGRRPRVATYEEVRVAVAKGLAAFEKRVRAMGYVIPPDPNAPGRG